MNNQYFEEKDSTENVANNTKKTVSIQTLIISVITAIVLMIIVATNWNNIMELFWVENDQFQNTEYEFLVWDEVMISGEIFDDWDIVNYTHILDISEYGEMGLKSKNINLNNYEWKVFVEWIVEKIQQDIPIVEVDTIYALDLEEDELSWDTEEEVLSEDVYLSNAWLYFDENFFDKYQLMNRWENWEIKIKNLENNLISKIEYFVCNEGISNQNCIKLNNTFSNSSAQKFVDTYGISYYKQSEVQSWFFTTEQFGYFVNDVEDQEFKDMINTILVVNDKFIQEEVLDDIDTICWEWWDALKEIYDYDLLLRQNRLVLDINGSDWEKKWINCEIEIDPSANNNANLLDMSVFELEELEETEEIEDTEEEDNSQEFSFNETNRDTDVDQFPLNLDKSLEFTSRRGHTIVFPSSSIAYAGKSVQEDFGQAGVNCFSVMNVVEYVQKDIVDTNGNIKIYECSVNDWFDDSAQNLIYTNVWDKHFVIEIVNPAWVDFANNVKIKI